MLSLDIVTHHKIDDAGALERKLLATLAGFLLDRNKKGRTLGGNFAKIQPIEITNYKAFL